MTNFQGSLTGKLTREQVLLGVPVLLGGLLAVLAGTVLLWPSFQQLARDQQELSDLKDQEARIPLLRQQLSKQRENLENAQLRERRILQLIAGSGDISTFMAQLSREARSSHVQLDSYEPVIMQAAEPVPRSAVENPPAKPDSKQKPAPVPVDPLLGPGLQKTTILVSARGSGPQLRNFLRRLETLNLLVVQSDLSLKAQEAQKPGQPGSSNSDLTTLKLNISLYSKASSPTSSEQPSKSIQPSQAKS